MTPTRPLLSRKAISFSPRSMSLIGVPSLPNSLDLAAGIQYSRMKLPITVPGPTLAISMLSCLMLTGSPLFVN